MQAIIPDLTYTVSPISVAVNSQVQQMLYFDMMNGYVTKDGITSIVSLAKLYADIKILADFKVKVQSHIQKAFEYEYQFFEQVVMNLIKT